MVESHVLLTWDGWKPHFNGRKSLPSPNVSSLLPRTHVLEFLRWGKWGLAASKIRADWRPEMWSFPATFPWFFQFGIGQTGKCLQQPKHGELSKKHGKLEPRHVCLCPPKSCNNSNLDDYCGSPWFHGMKHGISDVIESFKDPNISCFQWNFRWLWSSSPATLENQPRNQPRNHVSW